MFIWILLQNNPCFISFNTSYVNVYLDCLCVHPQAYDVSIHPMLMFIGRCDLERISKEGFNTSHVNVYPGQTSRKFALYFGFNTSHVNVYRDIPKIAGFHGIIVSIHPMLMFILHPHRPALGYFVSIHPMLMFIQRISAISMNNYTNFSSIYQLFSIFYQPIPHFIVFK